MKHFTSLVLSVVFCLGLVYCGSSEVKEKAAPVDDKAKAATDAKAPADAKTPAKEEKKEADKVPAKKK